MTSDQNPDIEPGAVAGTSTPPKPSLAFTFWASSPSQLHSRSHSRADAMQALLPPKAVVAAGLSASASVVVWKMLFSAVTRRKEEESEATTRLCHTGTDSVPALPPELYAVIVTHLSDDPLTLKACSLVSSDWLVPTRTILFHDILLTYQNLHPFLVLLRSPLCTFANFVRVLRLREGEYTVDRWIGGAIALLARSLVQVRHLDVYNLTWMELGEEAVRALVVVPPHPSANAAPEGGGGGFRKLEVLQVSTSYWESMPEFAGFLCSFPSLKHLVCQSVLLNCGCDEEEEGVREAVDGALENPKASREKKNLTLLLPSSLTSLYLSLPEEAMLRYFAAQPAVWGVRSLGLVVRESRLVPVANELLANVAAALKDLVLCLPDEGTKYENCIFTLRQNTALQSLRIRVTTPSPAASSAHDTTPAANSCLTWIPELIASIMSPHLEQLVFDIDAITELVVANWPWEETVRVVESTGHIREVLILVRRTSSNYRAVRRQLKEMLAQLGVGSERVKWRVEVLSRSPSADAEPWMAWIQN